jgi:hypothetical protein
VEEITARFNIQFGNVTLVLFYRESEMDFEDLFRESA